MQTLALGIFNGVSYGMLLFLMAAGLTLVFSMLGMLNFAHPAFYMLGAYFAYTFAQLLGLGYWGGLIAAPLCCALLGGLVERFLVRRVIHFGLLGPLLLTFGLEIVIVESVTLLWGKQPVAYAIPAMLDFPLFSLYGIDYSAYRAFTLVMTLAVLALLYGLLKGTRIGTTVRASLSHPEIVNALGHNLPRLRTNVFALGSALAGLAGALSGNVIGTDPGMANQLGGILMIVIVVGGLGSLSGAFVAALLIGVLQTLTVSTQLSWADLLLPFQHVFTGIATSDALTQSVSRFAPLVPFAIVIAVLAVRPRGLMGNRH
ncbi:branched-chain amino acid ABC transporter permease [Caballeronia sp. 15715]|jgi:branched-chain amino acid transport system permease protein|uniref:branched-chain amino acid ABC transporter permease n=1 Tax=unclassified Caballeronia TaxID=2646786 RepID=UPI0039E50FDF